MPDTFTPPQSVANNARRALEVRAEKPPSQRGMTPVGIARAKQLSNRQPLSLDTVRRMKAYFDRHEVDKQGSTWDEQGKGWQAWMGWGGDEGRTWASRIIQENTKMTTETKASRRHSESDMKLIRQARKNLAATMQVLADLGDDGMDDEAPDTASTDSAKRYAVKAEACAALITQLLAQTVHLYYKAHAAHWNVSSLDFPQYHEFFGELYAGMFEQIDPTAEFIRALGVKAPATLMELCAMMPVDTMTEDSDLEDMLASIAIDNQTILATIAQGIAITGIEGEFGVQNYLQDRMTQHQKLAWMLNQTLSGDVEDVGEDTMHESTEPTDIAVAEGDMAKALSDRNATPKEREAMPAGDFVIPETRNFPVVTPDDIPAAVSSWGRYQGTVTFEDFKARLIALAKRKGNAFVSALPQEWQDEMTKKALDTTMTMEVEAFAKRLLGR